MTESSTIFIRCPGCRFTVRALDDTACPDCGRCAFCGRKLESNTAHCGCQRAQDYEEMPWLRRDDVIPADQVATEVRRMEIRKQLELKETIVNACLGGVMLVAVGIGYPDIVHEKLAGHIRRQRPVGDDSTRAHWRVCQLDLLDGCRSSTAT